MRVNVQHLWNYVQCPMRYQFALKSATDGLLAREFFTCSPLFVRIMQAAYHYRILRHKNIPWANIRKLIGRYSSEDYEKVLGHALRWYESIYLHDPRMGIANVEAEAVSEYDVVADTIPLLTLRSERARAAMIIPCCHPPTIEECYNSFILRTYLWLASAYTRNIIDTVELVDWSFSTPSITRMRVHKGHDTMNAHLRAIFCALRNGIVFPSRTSHCSLCPYESTCTL